GCDIGRDHGRANRFYAFGSSTFLSSLAFAVELLRFGCHTSCPPPCRRAADLPILLPDPFGRAHVNGGSVASTSCVTSHQPLAQSMVNECVMCARRERRN